MKLLLDTHIFLWLISGDERLPEGMRRLVIDCRNEVFVSVVSLWEIIIKYDSGKLPLPASRGEYVPRQRALHGLLSLSVDEAAVAGLDGLPKLHRDPFDRLLISQAISREMTLLTVDHTIMTYPVRCWRPSGTSAADQ